MAKKYKSTFLGTSDKIDPQKEGCLFMFNYTASSAHDPKPLIIMISPPWKAKNGGNYFTGVNLKTISRESRQEIMKDFGHLPVGSVSYKDIQGIAKQDPSCCVRTYNTENVQALHKVGVSPVI